jgi:O-antigen/teichoic acid export membrane protein
MKILQSLIPDDIKSFRDYLKIPLYRNSIFLTLGRFLDVGFGFLFWTLAARLYSVSDVGIATALISSLGLVIVFSRFGFDTAIIRFMPNYDYSKVFNSCIWITTIMTAVVAVIYLIAIDIISPDIAFIKGYAPIFVLFAIVDSIALMTGYALISLRKADLKFIQNFILGSRLPLLFFVVMFGSIGIFYSVGIAYILASVFAIVMIRHYITFSFQIDREFIKNTFRFSTFNFLANLFQNIPSLVMPILIVNIISPEDAALYYVAFAIGNLVLIIPDAMSASFFVEGSHGINLRKGVVRSLAITYTILIPAILFIVFFGNILLGFFGKDYLAAFDLLKVIVLSSLFVTVYNLFIPLQNIRLHVEGLVILNFIRFILLLGLSYIFLIWFGVIGAGYAWALTHVIMTAGIAVFVKWKGWV